MENSPNQDLDQLMKWVQATYGSNREEMQASSRALEEMSKKNICQFIKSLMDIVCIDRNDDQIKYVKKATSILAGTLLSRYIVSYGLLADQFPHIVSCILGAMFSLKSPFDVKVTLKAVVTAMLKPGDSANTLAYFASILETKVQIMTVDEFAGVILVLQSFVVEVGQNQFTQRLMWFQRVQEQIVKFAKEFIEKVDKQIKESDLQSLNVNDKLSTIMAVLKLFEHIVKQLAQTNNKELLKVVTNPSMLELFATALDLQAICDKQIPECFISTTGIRNLDRNLNLIKNKILECFNHILNFVSTSKKGLTSDSNPFFVYAIGAGAGKALKTLFAVCETASFNLEEALQNDEFSECLVELMVMVGYLSQTMQIYDKIFPFFKRLLTNVCLLLMKTRKEEMDLFQSEPVEFVQLAEDTCDSQQAKTPKTQAAQLLEAICDNLQGSITFVVVFLLKSMEFAISSDIIEDIPTKYSLLKDYINAPFFQEKTSLIETALLALATISYHAFKRDDLVQVIGHFLEQFKGYFSSETLDPLIRSRFCTFIGYYFDALPENSRGFMLEFLSNSISTYETCQAVALSALESLSSIMQDEEAAQKLFPYMDMIVLKIGHQAKVLSSVYQLYDIIHSIFANYHSALTNNPELIRMLFEALVDKLVFIYLDENSQDKGIANKIWNIISGISEDEKFIPAYQEGIEQLMDPLFKMILNNASAPFGEQILSYVAAVTRISKTMSPTCWTMVRVFPKILLKTKNSLGPLFPALNQVIVSGDKFIYEDPTFVQTLIELGIQGINNDQEEEPMVAKCEFALLLQLILQNLSISDEDWERVLVATYDILKEVDNSNLKVKFGSVFLSGFISNFNLTLRVVETYNMETDLLKLFLEKCIDFEHKYERKLLVIGFCSMLTQGSNNSAISERLPNILSLLSSLLKYSVLIERLKKEPEYQEDDEDEDNPVDTKYLLKELIKTSLVDKDQEKKDEEEEDEDEDEEENNDSEDDEEALFVEKDAIKDLLNAFESEINKKDEFKALVEAIKKLHKDNNELLQQTIKKLPKTNKQYLRENLQTERIVIEDKDGKIQTKARMIAKVKGIKELKF